MEIFERYKDNPIININNLPYPANSVFNAAATKYKGEVLLLMRVEDRAGISHFTKAVSKDGVSNWKIDKNPLVKPYPEAFPEEIWGVEDPRITYIEEIKSYIITYTSYSESGPLVSLMKTEDFKEFERLGVILPPENKDAVLFPEKIAGKFVMLHRPVSTLFGISAHIWISYSPDLRYWGEHKMVIPSRKGGYWDSDKVGSSPPPLKTEEGWIVLYHGVRKTVGGSIYRLGLALLDLEDPSKVISRPEEWIFSPTMHYERAGDVHNIVFPCGWIAEGDKVYLYYGSADNCISLAVGSISKMIEFLKR